MLETCTFANSKDPDEMQHNAAFHKGLHCLLWLKKLTDKNIIFKNYNRAPLDMYNGLSEIYCNKPEGRYVQWTI